MRLKVKVSDKLYNMTKKYKTNKEKNKFIKENFTISFGEDVENEIMSQPKVYEIEISSNFNDDKTIYIKVDMMVNICSDYIINGLFEFNHIADYYIPNSIVIRRRTYKEFYDIMRKTTPIYLNYNGKGKKPFYLSKGKNKNLFPVYGMYNLSESIDDIDIHLLTYTLIYNNDNSIRYLSTGQLFNFIPTKLNNLQTLKDMSKYIKDNKLFYNLPELSSAEEPTEALLVPSLLLDPFIAQYEYDWME